MAGDIFNFSTKDGYWAFIDGINSIRQPYGIGFASFS